MPEAGAPVEIDAGVIGSAMAHRLDHSLEHAARREGTGLEGEKAGDAAHGIPK